MAELGEHCGLSRDVISDIENGRKDRYGTRRREITVGELMLIAEALGVSAYRLLPTRVTIASWPEENKMLEQAQAIVEAEERRLQDLWAEMGKLQNNEKSLADKIADSKETIKRQQEIVHRLTNSNPYDD